MFGSSTLSRMFIRRDDTMQDIRPGMTFRRLHPWNMIETAEILAVSTDDAGIPHVRFAARYENSAHIASEIGERTLALKTFADRYVIESVTGAGTVNEKES